MKKMNEIIIYVLFGLVGFIAGYFVLFKGYKNKVLEVLDTLKILNKIDNESYTYFKDKFIEKQDSLKRVRSALSNLKRDKTNE